MLALHGDVKGRASEITAAKIQETAIALCRYRLNVLSCGYWLGSSKAWLNHDQVGGNGAAFFAGIKSNPKHRNP
jgi:hypothetical protein